MKKDDEIINIFSDCLHKNNPEDEYMVVYGLVNLAIFSTKKIEEYKDTLREILDNILDEGEIMDYNKFNRFKDGQKWGSGSIVERLLLLSVAANLIEFTENPNKSRFYPYSIPYIARTQNSITNTLKKS